MPPLGVLLVGIFPQGLHGVQKLERCGYPMVQKFEDMFMYFDRIHEHDRQTDGHRTMA